MATKIGKFLKKAVNTVGDVWATTLPYTAAVAGTLVAGPAGSSAGFAAGQAASGAIRSFLPSASNEVVDQLGAGIVGIMGQPATSSAGAQQAGGIIKSLASGLGLSAEQSSIAGAIAHAAASLNVQQGTAALNQAAQTLEIMPEGNGFLGGAISKQEAKDVLNSTVEGVKTGLMTGIMDKTAVGQQAVKDATNAKVEDSMPTVLLIVCVSLVAWMAGIPQKLLKIR